MLLQQKSRPNEGKRLEKSLKRQNSIVIGCFVMTVDDHIHNHWLVIILCYCIPVTVTMPPKFQPTRGGAKRWIDNTKTTKHLQDENANSERDIEEIGTEE
ncbi:hypothetical protein HAX54_046502 [Datura stramonium]|uniref:Uncharacterized protein n=1 Tax=Datura stramonium TaxID=4076 RepID=A0ABS8WH30_DATST|nr:hypothetical protein [Datura stramonium]